jgi:hypothetical protein
MHEPLKVTIDKLTGPPCQVRLETAFTNHELPVCNDTGIAYQTSACRYPPEAVCKS